LPLIRHAREHWITRRKPFFDKALTRLVFIDETSTNTRLTKRTGWSPRGRRYRTHAPFGGWKTQTFIAGLRPVALAFRRPPGALAQPRAGRGFVDEDEPGKGLAEEAPAPLDPKLARPADPGTPLLAGLKRLFFMTEAQPVQQTAHSRGMDPHAPAFQRHT